MISMIAAVDSKNGIGKNGKMPWHVPGDLRIFKALTQGHTVIMGRKTYESIGRPLPLRENIVITSKAIKEYGDVSTKLVIRSNIWQGGESGFDINAMCSSMREYFVIGGGSIFREFMPIANRIYLSRIEGDYDCDTFFPDMPMEDWILKRTMYYTGDDGKFRQEVFERKAQL